MNFSKLKESKEQRGGEILSLSNGFEGVCCIALSYQKELISSFLFGCTVLTLMCLLQLSTVLTCKGWMKKFAKGEAEMYQIYWSSVLLLFLNFTTMTVMLSGHPL